MQSFGISGFTEEIQDKWKNNKNAFKDLIANHCNKTGATVCFHNSLKSFILPIEVPEGYWHDAWLDCTPRLNV
jgi:hypothetical protein